MRLTLKNFSGSFRIASFAAFLSVSMMGAAYAGCTPGIPCLDYNINTQTDAGTNPAYNALKTGEPAPYTTGACDGNFMNQIYGRAYLGATREYIMAQQIIRKPDSVLEYSCFDRLIAKTANNADAIFSGAISTFTNRAFALKTGDDNNGSINQPGNWYDPPTCGNSPCETYSVETGVVAPPLSVTRLDNNLNDVVHSVMRTYLQSNFNHNYLGGASSIAYSMPASLTANNNYNCPEMRTIWDLAMCSDFGEDDRFRNFVELASSDPRAWPQACSPGHIADDSNTPIDNTPALTDVLFTYALAAPCPAEAGPVAGLNTGITNNHSRLANNCNYTYANFDVYVPNFNMVKSPSINSSALAQGAAKLLFGHPPSTGHPEPCSRPIPTGVPVFTYTHQIQEVAGGLADSLVLRYVHFDHVCPNPGCYYVPIKVPMPLVPGSPLNIINIDSIPAVLDNGICMPL